MRCWSAFCLVLFFSTPNLVFAECLAKGYTVVYINGIFTDIKKASNDLERFWAEYVKRTGDTQTKFLNGYNQSHLAGTSDLAETFWQDGFSEESTWMDHDLQTILLELHKGLETQKVLLVGHSQGSYYSNEVYQYLTSHGAAKESVGVFNVGTPGRFVAGGGQHLNSSTDSLLNHLESFYLFSPLRRNINLTQEVSDEDIGALLDNAVTTWPGHSFSGAYLALAPATVIAHIQTGLSRLSDSGKEKEECFTPPEENIVYKVEKVFFAAADPSAIKAKQGAVVVGKGLVAAKDATVAAVGAVAGRVKSAFGFFVPKPRTENLPGSHSIVDALYGSSLKEDDLKDLLGTNQGGAVALAFQEPEAAELPVENDRHEQEGEILGAETGQEELPATPQEPLIPPPPAAVGGGGGISPGFGGGAPPAPAAEEPDATTTPAATSTPPAAPTIPAVISVSSDGATYTSFDTSPVRITITFNTAIATTSVDVQGVSQPVGDCGDTDAATMCIDYTLPAVEPTTNYSVTISGTESVAGATTTPDSGHSFAVDTLGPTLIIPNITTNTTLPIVRGTTVDSSPGIVVQVLVNGIFYQTNPVAGQWSVAILAGQELAEGSYTVAASSTDLFGNPPGNIANGTVIVDLTAPSILVTSGPADGDSVASTSPVSVGYTISDTNLTDVLCSFDSDPVSVCTGNPFSAALASGAHSFNLIANDRAGNQTAILRNFTVLP